MQEEPKYVINSYKTDTGRISPPKKPYLLRIRSLKQLPHAKDKAWVYQAILIWNGLQNSAEESGAPRSCKINQHDNISISLVNSNVREEREVRKQPFFGQI